MNNLISVIQKITMLEEPTFKKLCDELLSQIQKGTKSKIAFFGFLNNDLSEIEVYSSPRNIVKECAVSGRAVNLIINQCGLWADVVRKNKPVIENNLKNDVRLFKGHVAIKKLLSVPVYSRGKMVAVVAVANKESNYINADIDFIKTVSETVYLYLENIRSKTDLEFENKRLDMLIQAVPGYIYLQAKDYTIHYANSFFEKKFGKVGNKLCYELLWNRKSPCEICDFLKVFEANKPIEWEWNNAPDGRNYKVYDFPFTDIAENELVLEIGLDITEQKKAEEKIKASELKFRKLFEESRDSIFIAEQDTGILLDCNIAALKLIGREKSEIIGKHQSFLHPQEELDGKFSKTFKLHIGKKEGCLLETKIITGKGEIKNVDIRSTIVEIDGKLYAQGIFRDITEQKKIEEKLKSSIAQIEKEHRRAIYMLAVASENRDTDTGDHIKRIGSMTKKIALELGLTQEESQKMELDSLLHDIGKIGISDSILLKQGKLSTAEFELMKEHTVKGGKIIGNSLEFKQAREIALHHHERWDGEGYPNRLKGTQIPLSARIVAVVDVYDALISKRPYKEAWLPEDAVNQIQKESGSHFDPEVVDAFIKVMIKEKVDFNKNNS